MKKFIFLLLVLILSCTANPEPEPVPPCKDTGFYFDSSISEEDREIIRNASYRVNWFVQRSAIYIHENKGCPIINRDIGIIGDQIRAGSWEGTRILLDLKLIKGLFPYDQQYKYIKLANLTAEHEFLHALGLRHVEGPGAETSVMYWKPPLNATFTIFDKKECIIVNACKNDIYLVVDPIEVSITNDKTISTSIGDPLPLALD